jgi:serine O-acetyltransferase
LNAVKIYRVARALYKRKIPLLPTFFERLIFLLFNSVVPYTAEIGKGSRLNYGGIGVVIHKYAVIGENVLIGAGVTIGGNMFQGQRPVIGNNVMIAAGAKILGCKIGNNVIVGANAVVMKDVPDDSVVAGVPAKVLRPINDQERTFLVGGKE